MEPWQHELSQTIRSLEQLKTRLPSLDIEALKPVVQSMRLAITPHTAKLIDWSNPNDPLFLMSIPNAKELTISPEELRDPIGDEAKSPLPFLTHRYPDRVLIYTTFFCSLYCRFCFRRFKTGQANPGPTKQDRQRIVEYLITHPKVDEAILTGGDPLTLIDDQLEAWLKELRAIPTIHRIRIHTRVPVNLPSRITTKFIQLIKHYQTPTKPIYFVTHFNHPKEIQPENIQAISTLIDQGFVIKNQHILLKGINDDVETLTGLYKTLTNIRVQPYYLHQLDLAKGTSHFRVPIERGLELMKQLQGTITGIAIPRYMLDLPSGKGKIPLQSMYAKKKEHRSWSMISPFGESAEYQEPLTSDAIDP